MTSSNQPPVVQPPVVVLFGSQLGENIGTTARAMCNFGLGDLRLVAPREGWSQAKALAAAAGGSSVLEAHRQFATLSEALSDLDYVIAATARPRDMNKPVRTPETAAIALHSHKRAGILFGPERSGLDNESISLCDEIVEIPANPKFSSLNLAQAVLLIGYQYYRATPIPSPLPQAIAPKSELVNLFAHLESELDRVSFFRSAPKRPVMVRNLRSIFQRAQLSQSEIKALRGVVAALVDERARRK